MPEFLYRVLINPDFYDDDEDTGYYAVVWATSYEDALAQAIDECSCDNDRTEPFGYSLWLNERDENVPPRSR